MSRQYLTFLSAAILLATTQQTFTGVAQTPVSGPMRHIEATGVDALRTWDRYITDGERSGRLRVRVSQEDPDIPGRKIERLDQFYDGVRIWGADVVRNSDRGVPISIFGVLAPELSVQTRSRLTAETATTAIVEAAGVGASVLGVPELLVFPTDSGEYRLAYEAVVRMPAQHDVIRLIADAVTGQELLRYSAIKTQSAVGTGRGVLGDQKKLSVSRVGASYVTWDQLRPPTILTHDFRGDLQRFKSFELGHLSLTTADLASKADNVWTDPAVVDAHAHTGMALDYYYKRFSRNGIDGRNKPVFILTNALSQQAALSVSTLDLLKYATAAYAISEGGLDYLFFGNGLPPGFYLDTTGQNSTYYAGALDVVAHELTHLVVNNSSRLIYRNEAGALNEAFADMMGKGVEFFYRPAGSAVGQADYTLGKDISRAVRPGALNGIRSMANPGLFGDPDHYFYRFWRLNDRGQAPDNGYVHSNSGIANHAFYLSIEGGTHRVSRLSVSGVGATNREQIERAFFRAFTLLMPANSTFVTARAATTQAARDLYGVGSTAERAVDQAWTAVGVPTTSSVAVITDSVSPAFAKLYPYQMPRTGVFSSNLLGSDERRDLDIYAVFNTQACTTWRGLGRRGELLLAPSCLIDKSDSSVGWESIRMSVLAGETVALWVVNLSSTSQTFRLESFVEPLP